MDQIAARAYMYSGMWVADCPRGCNNTELVTEKVGSILEQKKTQFHCSYCRYLTDTIEWPSDMDAIEAVLSLRPIPYNRNWYPQDHPIAIRFNLPHGQSIDDLRQENTDHGVSNQ